MHKSRPLKYQEAAFVYATNPMTQSIGSVLVKNRLFVFFFA
jgi:hypothetical protein